jgi:hypothetical protein
MADDSQLPVEGYVSESNKPPVFTAPEANITLPDHTEIPKQKVNKKTSTTKVDTTTETGDSTTTLISTLTLLVSVFVCLVLIGTREREQEPQG